MKILEKLQLVKEMITRLVVWEIILTLKMIAIDLSKQQVLDADQEQFNKLTLQQI